MLERPREEQEDLQSDKTNKQKKANRNNECESLATGAMKVTSQSIEMDAL